MKKCRCVVYGADDDNGGLCNENTGIIIEQGALVGFIKDVLDLWGQIGKGEKLGGRERGEKTYTYWVLVGLKLLGKIGTTFKWPPSRWRVQNSPPITDIKRFAWLSISGEPNPQMCISLPKYLVTPKRGTACTTQSSRCRTVAASKNGSMYVAVMYVW